MIICFAGTHRNGKSTLAKNIAERRGNIFVPTNISSMKLWNKIGTPADNYCFAERLSIQEEVFEHMKEVIIPLCEIEGDDYFLDRSPVDLIGYLLANIDHSCSPVFDERVNRLIDEIIAFTKEHIFHSFVLDINPNIPYSPETGKVGKVYSSDAYRMAVSNNILASYMKYHSNISFSVIDDYPVKYEEVEAQILKSCEVLLG